MQAFIQNLPKAELHLHIEGTLEPELMFKLAERNKVKIPFKTVEDVQKAYQFTNLQSFLDIYNAGSNVLINEEDFYELTWAYLQKAKQQNIRHTEIFFDAQTHTQRGVAFATAVNGINQALLDAQRKLNISTRLILGILRDLSADSAFETLQQALPFKDWIIGIGLNSSELGNPPSKFKDVFATARAHGFLTLAHAGEEGPAEYVWEALDLLQVSRIDHGNKALTDHLLINKLVEQRTPLTVCPLSNLKLKVVKSMEQHPLKKMLDLGLCALVNSDDPAYFGGYVNENFLAVQQALNLSQDDLYQLAKNSFTATFLPIEAKQKLIQELDQYYMKHKNFA